VIRLPAQRCRAADALSSRCRHVRAHLSEHVPGAGIGEFSPVPGDAPFRLAVDEEDVKNLRTALRQACSTVTMARRAPGGVVELRRVARGFLLAQFNLPPQACTACTGPSIWLG